jgi:hypothetical protein
MMTERGRELLYATENGNEVLTGYGRQDEHKKC